MTATTDSKSAKAEIETGEPTPKRRLPETVVVGRVLRTHGVRGEVKVEIQSDVEERFEVGSELILVLRQEDDAAKRDASKKRDVSKTSKRRRRTVRIESIRPTRGASLILFEGCSTREEAEELRGARLEVDREKVPPAPEGFWYYYELIGCRVIDAKDGDLGKVVDLLEDGGGHLLRVRPPKGSEILVPLVGAFLREVDTENGKIETDLPEGLIEACTSKS